ncbi:PH domain-containing protein [Prevotella communis]|uniref:PH domain-containing protein n=1 Tax=Prevotella communis TaxID=2913614 RepID=UPI001EDBE894|nr:PH domain-containing protein [Prevotella communis]UKK70528.1 PH domain-containing protein [Prevotella communis]
MSKFELHAFDVKLDKTTKVLTAIVVFTLGLTIYLLVNRVILYSHKEMLPEKIGLAIICLTLITCIVFSPRKLILTNKELIVRCRAYSKHIPIKDIVSFHSEIIDSSSIRLFASGGLGGHYGLFWNSKYGKFKAFFGDRSSTFTIKLITGEVIVLGCENSQSLINELTSIIKKSQR